MDNARCTFCPETASIDCLRECAGRRTARPDRNAELRDLLVPHRRRLELLTVRNGYPTHGRAGAIPVGERRPSS